MFDTTLKKKRLVGLVLLAVLLGLFLWFNRIPKLDTVAEDLISATAPAIQCFQGLCIDDSPESSLLDRWWDFSLIYLKLVAVGMTFAFVIAGLTHAFLVPPEANRGWSDRGIKGSLRGLVIGPVMNLCSACIVPISSAFRRRGAGVETTLAIVQGSSTLNLPALIMVVAVFPPVLAGSRIGLSLVGALLLGPLVAFLVRSGPDPQVEPVRLDTGLAAECMSWRRVIKDGLRDWLTTSLGYLVGLGPIMVLAGFASGLAIQWISPGTVERYLGNDLLCVASAATFGLLINVPLLFEIPLVAALLLVGMGTAPAAVLLFAAAAGGPITFWGLARVLPKKTVLVFAAATWGLAAIAGLTILALGPLIGTGRPDTVQLAVTAASDCPACLLREAIDRASNGDTIRIPPGTYTLQGGELIIKKNITLEGAGAAETIIQAAAAPGVASHRVLRIPFGRDVTLSGVTIRHGLVDSTEPRHLLFPGTSSAAGGGELCLRRHPHPRDPSAGGFGDNRQPSGGRRRHLQRGDAVLVQHEDRRQYGHGKRRRHLQRRNPGGVGHRSCQQPGRQRGRNLERGNSHAQTEHDTRQHGEVRRWGDPKLQHRRLSPGIHHDQRKFIEQRRWDPQYGAADPGQQHGERKHRQTWRRGIE